MPNLWFMALLETPQGRTLLAAWVLWIIVSITLHELAHGWTAVRLGDRTPIDTGHMTWNPLVHMGYISLITFALTGMAWGAMPVDPTRLRGRHGEALMAVAGPSMNFTLALMCIALGGLWLGLEAASTVISGIDKQTRENVELFFRVGASLNVALGLFNLIPIYPLDGGRIIASYSRWYRNFVTTQAGSFLTAALFIVAFIFAGSLVFGVGMVVASLGIDLIGTVIAKLAGGTIPLILGL